VRWIHRFVTDPNQLTQNICTSTAVSQLTLTANHIVTRNEASINRRDNPPGIPRRDANRGSRDKDDHPKHHENYLSFRQA